MPRNSDTMLARTSLFAMALVLACFGAGPRISNVPPSAGADVPLSDGRTLHARELPLARLDGVIRDGAQFDRSGTRVAFLASFPAGAVGADYRRADPTQAYVADIARRTLLEVSADGRATAIAWHDENHVEVSDGGVRSVIAIAGALPGPRGREYLDAISPSTSGTLVSPPNEFRLQVVKTSDNGYAIGQVGAVRLRSIAVAADHRCVLAGSLLVWIDAGMNGGSGFSRSGPDTVLPPTFPGTAYGDSLTPILPLGHVVYQAAYRNGVAYFAFSYGLARIVAATSDFVNYAFPSLPTQPDFTVGDGLGAGADGVLYFADPENGVVQFWRDGRYVERSMQFPNGVSDTHRLDGAMRRLSPTDAMEPPMRPDADALDAAMLEWRIYPIGDTSGPRWIASYLGRAFIAGANLRFAEIAEPAFPFAVLGRTDDGRVWGAMPQSRTTRGAAVVSASSMLMFSRDGQRWTAAATLDGDPGAVGLHDGVVWAAMSKYEGDAAGVEVARVLDAHPKGAPIGAIFAGEDMFFADVGGNGWYLICGGAPGTRADDGSGPLVALRLDSARLFSFDDHGQNVYLSDRLDPLHLYNTSGTAPADAFISPSAMELVGLQSPYSPTMVDDAPTYLPYCCRSVSFDAERQFEVEYAWRPYPIATVHVIASGDTATVRRTIARGPLAGSGQTERWTRDRSGPWILTTVVSRWRI